ncbi:unnamed protein product [Prunus armeniaca]|uniref:Uncharacterized protein n=1 Tax=Prunus armeniaca TaxID=36596 RepID=A0A6J5UA16_PRUAR|nr:unnamed protein product [Prunus armeniaca]
MASSRLHIFVLAFCASLLFPSNCSHGGSGLQEKRAALFIFGDSLFDVGNNNYINTTISFKANNWPYGETFFKYPTGRASDGRLIPDFIAEYAKLPFIPPYLQPGFNNYTYGVNFASAGGGALSETHQGFVKDLKTQVSYFKNVEKQLRHKLGDAGAYTFLSEAVYLISIGINDYYTPVLTNSSLFASHSHEEYVGMVVGNLTDVIEEIYKKGGRKFGFANGVPLGCIPSMRILKPENIGACSEEVTALVKLHSRVVAKGLLKLKSQLHGFRYSNANFYTPLTDTINNPSKYGFKEGKMACCGSGPYRGIMSCGGKRGSEFQLCDNVTEYVFFDSSHPTERVYQQISKLWWSGSPNVTKTSNNLKELFEV